MINLKIGPLKLSATDTTAFFFRIAPDYLPLLFGEKKPLVFFTENTF